ncbi:hypothetical protein BC749_104133 [Flavobacterium araucananum]|nr:hypothetical protein BC749_104133 [Flavobacterium araucananum]
MSLCVKYIFFDPSEANRRSNYTQRVKLRIICLHKKRESKILIPFFLFYFNIKSFYVIITYFFNAIFAGLAYINDM